MEVRTTSTSQGHLELPRRIPERDAHLRLPIGRYSGFIGPLEQKLADEPDQGVTSYPMEATATTFDRYGPEDVCAFSTDFPHEDDGKDPIGRLGGNTVRHGEVILEKLLVSNAKLILPGARQLTGTARSEDLPFHGTAGRRVCDRISVSYSAYEDHSRESGDRGIETCWILAGYRLQPIRSDFPIPL